MIVTTLTQSGLILRAIKNEDIQHLMVIAAQWVKDRRTGALIVTELTSIKRAMQESLHNAEQVYFVVTDSLGKPLGMCALRPLAPEMLPFILAEGKKTLELTNVYLDIEYRGKGIGKLLLTYCFDQARTNGVDAIVWNSGPRYKHTAWDFYTRLVGAPIAIIDKLYGEGGDAPVWRKIL